MAANGGRSTITLSMETTATAVTSRRAVGGASRRAVRELLRNRRAIFGLIVLALLLAATIMAPLMGLSDPTAHDTSRALTPPGAQFLLGSDSFGRDILSRVVHGSRISLLVGAGSIALAVLAGVPIGVVTGYYAGVVDAVFMRAMDGLLSFPPILIAIAMMAALGPDVRNVILTLGIVYMLVFARLARGSTLTVRQEDYVKAAVALGARHRRVMWSHILPNIAGPIIVQASASFSTAIVAEATLSFLGLGTSPPTPSWGLDLSDGRRYLERAPWLVIAPAMAMSISVLGINVLGDGIREALDPRLGEL